MPRAKSKLRPKRLPLSLLEPTHALLETLVSTGGYGNGKTEAVKMILMRHLQELEARGKINLFKGLAEAEMGDKK